MGFSVKNYLVMAKETAYILTLDLPVIISSFIKKPNSFIEKVFHGWNNDTKNHLKKLNYKGWMIALIATVITWVVSSHLIGTLTNPPVHGLTVLALPLV